MNVRLSDLQLALHHVSAGLPNEACGIIAFSGVISCGVFPVDNNLASPYRYEMNPRQQIEAMQYIDAHGFQLGILYHSHPVGAPVPSQEDIAKWAYPESAMLIFSPGQSAWHSALFIVIAGEAHPIPMTLVS